MSEDIATVAILINTFAIQLPWFIMYLKNKQK